MKKIILLLVFNLLMCGFAFAQTPFAELDKVREIRLLESNRKNVKRILKDFEHDKDEDDDYTQSFSTENAEIKVTFSKGNCSEDDEYWNVAEWIVTKVVIIPENDIKVEDFKFDFSNFTKETEDEEYPEDYIYQNEYSGIVFQIEDNEIWKIVLFPSKNNSYLLCENEKANEISSNEKRLVDSILEDGITTGCVNAPPTVDNVTLSATEIIIGCSDSAENKSCSDSDREISVTTVANDRENDVLTYSYIVSGGKIVGNGAKVIWDLTGVEAGTYTITAGVDDGCGICGPTKTQTVVVKECPDCSPK